MPKMRYVLFQREGTLEFVEMPSDYAYQLSALNLRLCKEIGKLTASGVPKLPAAVAECDHLELLREEDTIINGLDYVNRLERAFASIQEDQYPLIALLTEIRALQAQMEQWYEEEYEG
ncbi:hydrolase/acyltransferase [Paenibacillus apiarius]|uniref:Hydrolase/acyltransferase n=1 Tax=Paenibacillus apiarius TaxID=46240 RepID=A0ABT4DUP3_9BACL|nr:hydrolase/acyltransferase [Paenibacillus apiarius]MBN3523385.1 hydrolase/acyltransferase [Paenibacillus apiarius]MCY9514395.1 hydrolase/acyltransferase [Paenibacillus apiarius]MCY9521067.1 hydrolase/acyltransferase [Paenibacillus apiarius]MCY9551914.1 hydrolase/acyltransferase [Paenibacillus apiarius]MCY9557801.1 hydrolase/acyltransferase [Paenibacillus apiarius]